MGAPRKEELDSWDWAEAHRVCLRIARRYVRDPSEAEDVAQEALLRAWRRRGTLRKDARRAEWLRAIARNEALRHVSRKVPEPTEAIEAAEGREDERLAGVAERADVGAAVGRLDASDQLLLRLRYTEDLTQAAIARLLEVPEGTVKVRLHRARAKLREEFE